MIKRIIGLLVCASVILSSLNILAESETDKPAVAPSETAIAYLDALGIDSSFCKEETIQRGAYVTLVLKLMNISSFDNPADSPYIDVDDSSEWYAEICSAANLGIISGYGGDFRPEDNITFMEALKIMMDVLGYKQYAALSGGYPAGYLKLAAENRLIANSAKVGNETASGYDIAGLIEKAVETEVLEQTGNGAEITYQTKDGHDLLWRYFDLQMTEGILTAAKGTSITNPNFDKDSKIIEIDGVPFDYSGDCSEFLGQNIRVYADKDYESEAIFVIPYENDILTMAADELESYKSSVLQRKSEYGRKKYVLDKSFSFVYNSGACLEPTEEKIIPDSGFVTIIDNNDDGEYDVVITESYDFMRVTAVNQLDGIIYGSTYNNAFPDGIDTGKDSAYFSFYTNIGTESIKADFSEITTDAYLACSVSENGLHGKIYILDNTVSGTVNATRENTLTVDGTEYLAAKALVDAQTSIIGANGRFYRSPDGKLAIFVAASGMDFRYGYIIRVSPIDADIDSFTVKMLTESGKIMLFEAAPKIRFDGKSTDAAAVRAALTGSGSVRQFVKYSCNGDVLTGIDTATDKSDLNEQEHKKGDSLYRYYDKHYTPVKSGTVFANKFFITSEAIIFVVPDESTIDVTDDDFACVGTSYFANDTGYTMSAYDMGDDGFFDAYVVYGSATTNINDYSDVGVVENLINTVPDDDLDDVQNQKLYLWNNGSFVSYFVGNDVNLYKDAEGSLISTGDIVRYVVKDGVIVNISVDFISDEMAFTTSGNTYLNTGDVGFNRILGYGKYSLYKKYGTYCYFSPTRNNDGTYDYAFENLRAIQLSGARLVEVNKTTGKLRNLYVDDIYDYVTGSDAASEMVLKSRYWNCNMGVVYVED